MTKTALLGLLTMAAAGVLAAAIFMVAKAIAVLLFIALFIGALILALKAAM